jgi:hypothetical protein
MFKKLLVVALAMAFLMSLCNVAMAAKDPNQFKRGALTIGDNPNAGRINWGGAPVHPPTAPYTGGTPQYIPDPQPLQRGVAATCGVQLQYGSINFFFNGAVGFGQAVRWDAGTDVCTLKTISLVIYQAASTTPNSGGITAYVWADDGTGLPGAVIQSTNVPHASVLYYPSTTDVMPNVVISGGEYHTGYIPNNAGDTYAALLDNGSGGANASTSLNVGGTWFGNGGVFVSGDINWVQEIETCCYTPGAAGVCSTQEWHCTPAWRWTFTKTAERFTATGECTLKTASFLISSFGTAGFNAGINARVYANNSNLPGAILATVFVPHASILYSPSYTVVDFSSLNLVFTNEDYFVGYESVNPAQVYQGITDDGGTFTCPDAGVLRGVAWDGTQWDYMYNLDEFPAGTFWDDNYMYDVFTCCGTPEDLCDNLDYAGAPFYYWPEPDAYGDQFRNQRFTNASYCTLKTVNLAFDAGGSVGAPGATVYLWNSDGLYPTSVITSAVVNPVTDFFPTFTSVDISALNIIISADYHVGYSTIINNPGDVLSILSDDGSLGANRSVEFYLGQWWLMANSWGVDVNFLINVDVCCLPPGVCPMFCDPTDQWPAFSHDFQRTGQSHLTLGDLCGVVQAWKFVGTSASNFCSPVISNDLVLYAHDDRVQAVNLLTGVLVWDTKVGAIAAGWALAINNALRSQLTINGGAFYVGTGSLRGFAKGDLLTGAHIWSRGLGVGSPLPGVPGQTRYAGSIISGNEVYFGDDNGQIYALNATTGADLYFAQLLTSNALKGGIFGAPSTDGSSLFFPTAANLTNPTTGIGGIHSVTPGGSFTPNWYFESPFIAILHEGFASAPSVRCDNLFIHATFAFGNQGNFAGYRQNLNPATGVPNWANYFLMGQNSFGGNTATTGSIAYFHNINNGFGSPDLNTKGVRAVNFANTTVWVQGGVIANWVDNGVWQHVSTTCDPYLVYGGYDYVNVTGNWRIVDGATGAILIDYPMTAGRLNGTAIATGSDSQDYLVLGTQTTNHGAAPGGLYAFKIGGPRPRLAIPEPLVAFTGTNVSEASPVQRTDNDAVLNTGCAQLDVTATLEAGDPPLARRTISDVHPSLLNKANYLVSSLTDYTVEEMMNQPAAMGGGIPKYGSVGVTEDGEVFGSIRTVNVKPAKANSEALAPPSWVDWVSPFSGGASVAFSVAAGGSQAFTFEFDRSGMNFLAPNYYYVEIGSNDPDYDIDAYPGPQPAVQAVIEYQIPYEYCAIDTGRIDFGTAGVAWYSNYGAHADGDVAFEFSLDGSTDGAFAYEGTMFFMTSMDDAAWTTFGSIGIHYLYPFYVGPFANSDCGGCDFGATLPVEYTTDGGSSYANTIGDICTFAVVDSLQGLLDIHQAGPSIGLLVDYRKVGTYGADFGDFVLYVADINNRNGGAVNGLYYGSFMDWDIGTDFGFGDPTKGYLYQNDGPDIRGFIGLPLNGSYWPDGSKTDPMYNARTLDNPTDVYTDNLLDSLFVWVDSNPEDGYVYVPDDATTQDKSSAAAFGKVDLAGFGSKSYGFAIYGMNTANPNGDSEALSKFINKYAGFARGDVNDDDIIDLRDLVKLSRYVSMVGQPGPSPFKHLGDVDNDGDVDSDDCAYLAAYYFSGGTPPKSAFMF